MKPITIRFHMISHPARSCLKGLHDPPASHPAIPLIPDQCLLVGTDPIGSGLPPLGCLLGVPATARIPASSGVCCDPLPGSEPFYLRRPGVVGRAAASTPGYKLQSLRDWEEVLRPHTSGDWRATNYRGLAGNVLPGIGGNEFDNRRSAGLLDMRVRVKQAPFQNP